MQLLNDILPPLFCSSNGGLTYSPTPIIFKTEPDWKVF